MISARKLVFFLLFNAAGVAFATDSSTSLETSTTKTDSAINTSVEKQSKSKASETAREDAKKKDVKTPIESSSSEEQALTVIEIKTSKGTIKLQLDGKAAPITAKNFISYVKDKHYDDTVFHRVIDGFMIQGGGFRLEGHNLVEKETKNPITNEAKNGLKNVRGSIAMARTADPNSATAQFFINLVDNARLDYPYPDGNGYAVFGKVVEGMDIVDKIAKVKTGFKSGMADVPTEDVKIVSMTVVEKAP